MRQQVIEIEVEALLAAQAELDSGQGRWRMVRNGHLSRC